MLPKEIAELFDDWQVGCWKVFKYYYFCAEPGTIVILRQAEEVFIVEEDRSTDKIGGPFNKQELDKLLFSGKMEWYKAGILTTDYKKIRTGGCECGAWATNNPNCHSTKCPQYNK